MCERLELFAVIAPPSVKVILSSQADYFASHPIGFGWKRFGP